MSATWDEIRIAALQKMFLITGSVIEENDSTRPYLAAMPWAYNEAVELLSTASRYIDKEYEKECDAYSNRIVINLAKDIPDLYQLKPNGIYHIIADYIEQVHNFKMLGENYLLLPNRGGTYRIFYRAYPLKATTTTAGQTDMQLDDDVAAIIPLYIASQLYKDDDISIATVYRNEFEVAREELLKERNGSMAAEFHSNTGWW